MAPESFRTNEFFFWHGASFTRAEADNPEILGTGATLHLGSIRLHVKNLARRADFLARVNGVSVSRATFATRKEF